MLCQIISPCYKHCQLFYKCWPNFVNLTFWTVSARVYSFHTSIPCDKTFPWVPLFFYHVTLTLEIDLLFGNFNFDNKFWTVGARINLFHMSIPCDKTFPWVLLFFTPWSWPWNLTYFLNNIKLFNYIFTVSARALIFHINILRQCLPVGTNNFDLMTLTLKLDLLFEIV